MVKSFGISFVAVCFIFLCSLVNFAQLPVVQEAKLPSGKPPIIIIPGITGSQLINQKTKKVAWFNLRRTKDDDLRLPISPNLAKNRDDLAAGDILRGVKVLSFLPETEIYEKLIAALETHGNYTEGQWDKPPVRGDEDTFYVFPYDWRRDNVENARLLVQKVDALKRKLKRPNLKFNIIAHSMGGLIARYAAMYGTADLPAGNLKPKPTWAGARDFDKVFLLGTPNEGSVLSLSSLLNGYAISSLKISLPFIQNLSKFDIFTIPAAYQLLPHEGTMQAYDENLKPFAIDVYDVNTWNKYGWSIFGNKDFAKKLSINEQKNARAYFAVVLKRAKRFQEALDANSTAKIPVSMFIVGGDCKDTLNAVVIYRDEKKGEWKTLFKPDSFNRINGEKVTSEELKTLMFAPGDGVVTKRSLLLETLKHNNLTSLLLPVEGEIFLCESHTRLVTNAEIQEKLLALISDQTVK